MNAREQTDAETAHFEVVERYLREMLAKPSSLTDDERTLIAGNIRGFYATAFPFEDDADGLLKDAEAAIQEYSCRTQVSHIASEMETLAARVRAYRLSEKHGQISDAQRYFEALESIDAVAVDFGHFESAARTMQEIARKAIGGDTVNVFEEAASIADAAYGDAPSGHYDNGATQDGWQMACTEIAMRLRAVTVRT